MTQDLVVVKDLEITYPASNFKLGPLQLAIPQGRIVAVLGQNGAGKSTLFQMLTGNLRPQSGTIHMTEQLVAFDRPEIKRKIGYLPQALQLPSWINGSEILSYAIRLYELDEPEKRRLEALRYWDCEHFAHKPLAACSHGMQKRVGLALATIHDPKLLILDEPFSGLDLYHIRSLQSLLMKRRQEGKATVLSTHIAPYAAQLCDSVILIQSGKIHQLERWNSADLMQRVGLIEEFFFPKSESKA